MENPKGRKIPGNPLMHFNLLYFLIAMLAASTIHNYWVQSQSVEVLSYSQFQKYLEEKKIKNIVVTQNVISGEFETPLSNKKRYFTTIRVDPALAAILEKYDI